MVSLSASAAQRNRCVSPHARAYVAYRQRTDSGTLLEIATNAGGAWRSIPIAEPEPGWRVGGPAIVVDATGAVHVTFLAIPTGPGADAEGVELRYARTEPPNGVDEDCDSVAW